MIQVVALRGGVTHLRRPLLVHNLADVFLKNTDVINAIPEPERVNVYYTLAHHSGADIAAKPQRTSKTFLYQEAIAFDIDSIPPGMLEANQERYLQTVAEVLTVSQDCMTIVSSGHGLHFIIFLKSHLRKGAQFQELKPYYNALCSRITETLASAGLPGKADPTVFEPARILRLPGTINRKPEREDSECRIVSLATTPLDFSLVDAAGMGDLAKDNFSPAEIRRRYPRPDLKEILSPERGCLFLKWALANPSQVHEPQAFDVFSILAQVPETERSYLDGTDKSPRELAEHIFNNATASSSLARTAFDNKWEQAVRYGGRKCSKIDANWACEELSCKTCGHYGRLPTPLAIAGPEHVQTESQGFWVYDQKGNPKHPHYEDLFRVFKREYHYLACAGSDRLMAFNAKYYQEFPNSLVKSWVEDKVDPREHIREAHRLEFLHKIQANNVLIEKQEREIFEEQIKGKINLLNGVLDVTSGTLLDHSPSFGFRYVLPYAYNPDFRSEFFLDWLDTISCGSPDIMETIMDVMGYCMLPGYDDHVFAILLGEGANGKSTLIHVIQELVGKENFASVSLQQLTSNRFAPASLDGKLVNLSEESSGRDISSEQLNVIKTLSSGGELFVERKGENGYVLKNAAKLVFSMNKAPKFAEDGVAIKRRLLTIPFDYRIVREDPTVESRLVKEAPGIFTLIVDHIQRRLKEGNGVYRVRRSSREFEEAQKKILTSSNTALMWAEEFLDSRITMSDDHIVEVDEAYSQYRAWCQDSGLSFPQSRPVFGKALRQFFLQKSDGPDRARRGDRQVRVFRRVQWKEAKYDV